MQARTGTPIDIVLVVQSLIVLFIAAPPLVRAVFRLPSPDTPRAAEAGRARHREGGQRMSAPTIDATASAPARPASALVLPPIKWHAPIAYAAVALLGLVRLRAARPDRRATARSPSRPPRDFIQFPPFSVPVEADRDRPVRSAALALAGVSFYDDAPPARRPVPGCRSPTAFLMVFAFLVWAVAGKDSGLPLTGLLAGLAVPRGPAGLRRPRRRLLCERSGIINIAIEGQLLGGAFLAAVVATLTGSPYVGLIAAPVAGALVGAAAGLFAIRYVVNQIIVGVVLNVLVIGADRLPVLHGAQAEPGHAEQPAAAAASSRSRCCREIPIIGPVLFRQTCSSTSCTSSSIVLQIMLFRTRWGLRAAGRRRAPEGGGHRRHQGQPHPLLRATCSGGAVAGLGGAFFTVAAGLAFGKEMTGGRGLHRPRRDDPGPVEPDGARCAAALLFGFADNLQLHAEHHRQRRSPASSC